MSDETRAFNVFMALFVALVWIAATWFVLTKVSNNEQRPVAGNTRLMYYFAMCVEDEDIPRARCLELSEMAVEAETATPLSKAKRRNEHGSETFSRR